MYANPTTEQWFSVSGDISKASEILTRVSDRMANGEGFVAHWTGGDTSDTQHVKVIELRSKLLALRAELTEIGSEAVLEGCKAVPPLF